MGTWNDLSLKEKSAMMKVAVQNGITNLGDIKQAYNEFADGGNLYGKGGKKKTQSRGNAGAQRAMQYFMSKGLAEHQAAGLVGNLMRESGMSPTALNKSSAALGLAQWLGGRKKALIAKYGSNPTFDQQLDFIWHELNTTHKNGLKHLLNSKTAAEAARNAMGYYEFSAGPEAAIAAMNRTGQAGNKSMSKGIEFASQLMGIPVSGDNLYMPQESTGISDQQQLSLIPTTEGLDLDALKSWQQGDSQAVTRDMFLQEMEDSALRREEQYNRELKRIQELQQKQEAKNQLNALSTFMGLASPSGRQSPTASVLNMLAGSYKDGGNLYKKGGPKSPSNYVYDVLPKLFAKDGVKIRVSSGYRPNAVVQGSNRPSRHSTHEAADIVGDFSAIRKVLDDPNSHVSRWMLANGYGFIDETSATGTTKYWHDHDKDHSHYHIGKDSGIAGRYANMLNGKKNIATGETTQSQDPFEGYEFTNLEAIENPEAIFRRLEMPETRQPLVEEALASAYSPEEIERQERAEGLNRLGLMLSLTGNTGTGGNSSLLNTLGMLGSLNAMTDSNVSAYGGNLFSGEDTPTQQMTSSFTASHPEYNPATNKWETTIESVLPEVVVTGKRIIKPSQNNNKQEKQRHVEPQTFAGRVAQVAGASPQYVKGADMLSSIAQMSPQGHYIAALDLGYDANRAMHGEEGSLKDVGLDALSMLPYVSKLGLKEVKPKTIQKAAKNFYDKMLQPVMDRVNNAIKVGKRVDFIDDTMGTENAPLYKKAYGGHIYGGEDESTQQMTTADHKKLNGYYYVDSEGYPQLPTTKDTIELPDAVVVAPSRNSLKWYNRRTVGDWDENGNRQTWDVIDPLVMSANEWARSNTTNFLHTADPYGDIPWNAAAVAFGTLTGEMAAPYILKAASLPFNLGEKLQSFINKNPIPDYDYTKIINSSFYDRLTSEFGEETAKKIANEISTPEFKTFFLGSNPKKAFQAGKKHLEQMRFIDDVENAGGMIGGSAQLAKHGSMHRKGLLHDLDFFIPGSMEKRSSPVIDALGLETHANRRVSPFAPTGTMQKIWRNVMGSPEKGYINLPQEVGNIEADMFIREHMPTTQDEAVQTILDAKKAFGRPKDVADIEGFIPYSAENPVINMSTGEGQWNPTLFNNGIFTQEGYPYVQLIETYPGSGVKVPAIMNYRGEIKGFVDTPSTIEFENALRSNAMGGYIYGGEDWPIL